MAQVLLEDLSRVFPPSTVALHQVDLEVRENEFVVLLGPSGSGKTTVLRLVSGLDQPTSGRVRIGGRDASRLAPWERGVAMVFQHGGLFPHLTARENMLFGARRSSLAVPRRGSCSAIGQTDRSGETRTALLRRTDEVAGWLEIRWLLDRRPRELSGGERQRVALARALIRERQVRLLDEPLSSLDAALRSELRTRLRRLHGERPATTLYVTHDQAEAMTLADRLVVLDRGRVLQVGTPEQVYHRPANRTVASLVGSPAMNFLEGVLRPAQQGWSFATCWGDVAVDRYVAEPLQRWRDGRLVMGIRPEHLRLTVGGGADSLASAAKRLLAIAVGVEYLGANTIVHVSPRRGAADAGAVARPTPTMAALASERCDFRPGDGVEVDWDLNQVHWFDPTSDERLGGTDTTLN